MDSRDIRNLFVRFFEERGHRNIPSSSLIPPPEERTLLFSNAGMNQMKPYFMGLATPPATRMTSVQKCFRTSDIEEVGDGSHCTFFEMLGNFSVGDYFKAEVISWAWELLTAPEPQGMGFDPARLWATVYLDDEEAFSLWRGVGMPAERIVRFDESENYWFMIKGGAGPCGPNSEIYYDFGPEQGCGQPGCTPPTHDCGRFLEIWNLVFMSLYQEEDGKTRRPLPQRNVDTGAGLERWLPVYLWQNMVDWQGNPRLWQSPPTIYDTGLFRPIIASIEEMAGIAYDNASPQEQRAIRVVAEHARAATFLIADGVTPANDGRGYVLRHLIRRGTSFGQRLKPGSQFLAATASSVINLMASSHANLTEQRDFVLQTLHSEETRFFETLTLGRNQLEDFKRQRRDKKIAGREVFQLWDTHGFPPELTQELLTEDGYEVEDPESFEALMQEQRQRSRAATRFEGDAERIQTYAELGLPHTEFLGYETTRAFAAVSAIVLDGATIVRSLTPELAANHRVEIVLTQTPFYAEGGGQVGDQGELLWPGGRFVVEDTQAVGDGGVSVHMGRLEGGSISVGDPVEARVDEAKRGDTMRNHTATHILHAALRQVVGTHARQAGSLVTPERLRFDFTHMEALTLPQLREVELLANQAVRNNIPVSVQLQSYEDAIAGGALAFFGDKYADTVRVVGVCDIEGNECFSKELCGGTHVHASGDVGSIVITAETSIGAGLRRIEAVTGRAAAERVRELEERQQRLSAGLRVPPAELETRIGGLREENERLRKQLQAAERKLAQQMASGSIRPQGHLDTKVIIGAREEFLNHSLIVTSVPDVSNADMLRSIGDTYKNQIQSEGRAGIIFLAAVVDDKPAFLAMCTPDAAKKVSASDIVRAAARKAGGGGGGRPEVAQGGGTDVSKIDAALAAARRFIEEKLNAAS